VGSPSSARGVGTKVRVYLPAATDAAVPGSSRALDIPVTVFNDPDEAAVHFLAAPGAIDVLVTDLTMPGMTGTRLAECLRRRRATLPVVIATGVTAAVTVGADSGLVVLRSRIPGIRSALPLAACSKPPAPSSNFFPRGHGALHLDRQSSGISSQTHPPASDFTWHAACSHRRS
jgi:CheY-like chemotaxis protein